MAETTTARAPAAGTQRLIHNAALTPVSAHQDAVLYKILLLWVRAERCSWVAVPCAGQGAELWAPGWALGPAEADATPSLTGVHVLGLPGGVQAADGAAAAHGVTHRGDAVQGQQGLHPTSLWMLLDTGMEQGQDFPF